MCAAVDVRWLGVADRDAAVAHLAREPRENLFLLDLAARLGSPPAPGEMRAELLGAWRAGDLVGVVALRPSVAFDANLDPEVVDAAMPHLESLGIGLVKSAAPGVDALWQRLGRRGGRRAVIDRFETAYAVGAAEARLVPCREGERVRRATPDDLESLVVAARESLREESRPDPFSGDVRGFRRWVAGRVPRARVLESQRRIVFVGYADVQRREGWLLQGVYTWPEWRRRGCARVGISQMCREAFEQGAEHVQLSVVHGNVAGQRLYESLGFKPYARLRTILFA